ncbi:diguanylate cyclase [Candidatus Sulfurimonas marisnigri]|uniref:diguanylate cyclase n=1 Tax=Candidatus Sulfurimonas marisnigri TaxID=2740405 RepID=A0A7S7M0M0_9BACT|nr:diguanylate cyclase [Candidatus Sulfurimonas marisnigri]QOY54740.1 diguanylate cyclase [Candidatus Sulfurimonas marisnigri]
MQEINAELIHLHECTFNNISLLEQILNELNSAVVAKELDWIANSDIYANEIKTNLEKHFATDYGDDIKRVLNSFQDYYITAKKVSTKLINSNYNYENINSDTALLVKKYNNIYELFNNLKLKLKDKIEQNMNSIYENSNSVISNGSYIFILWLSVSIIVTVYISQDFKFRINQIVEETRQIASGDADFNKRLCIVSYDELGDVTKSINLFINKLHQEHEELVATKEELKSLYVLDSLTKLYNRVKIDEIIDIEIQRINRYINNSVFSIIIIDIDHFKSINDTHGHLVGDTVLEEFALILKNNARATDYVGRWGGEEFIIICIETDANGAMSVAEKLRTSIEKFDFTTVGHKTASFGVASSTKGIDAKTILDNADKALYRAKNNGRNQVINYSNLL